jgi:hypothetical protein
MICIVCLLFPIQQYDKTYGAGNSTTGIGKSHTVLYHSSIKD